MFYVVPAGHSVIKSEGKFKELIDAQRHALKLQKETGKHYTVIHLANVWSTTEMDA